MSTFLDAPHNAPATVYVVDDQAEVLESFVFALERSGYQPQGFRSAADVMSGALPAPACVVIDWNLAEHDGLEVAAHCRRQWPDAGLLLISGAANLEFAVQAMRLGAQNVLPKPLDPALLGREVSAAIAAKHSPVMAQLYDARRKFERLPPREREILKLVAQGVPNKNIAGRMELAMRTIEKRRRHIFDLLEVDSAAEATRIYVLATLQ